ncbi:MAG: sigma 54-interacting transcriptional regulator [Alphaproteobacteria bacterium]|nr:sigma 54-interacting transcriptional regulator [Alphaproteobacteria bacterium]
MGSGGELVGWARRVGVDKLVEAFARTWPDAAVFAVDGDRRILYWSDGAERLLGFDRADIVGEHCLKANRCPSCMQGCGISRLGHVAGARLEMFDASGTELALRKDAQAFFDDDGTFLGGIEVLHLDTARSVAPEPVATADVIDFHGLRSASPQMHRVFDTVRRVAETDVTVLVRGESGTGKELIARALHDESPRASGPFVAVNCAALTPGLLEAELFGHVRGAFTGAVRDRAGLFEQADGGTLFLDEIAELPLDMQAKLLRVLESGEVVRVGASRTTRVDCRVVAATHRSLREEVREGRFREDLMYRLRVVPLFLPALRERPMDVDLLFEHFLRLQNQRGSRRMTGVDPAAMRVLLEHDWPGNVRELRNVVAYAFAVGPGPRIRREDLPPELREDEDDDGTVVPLHADEPTRIKAALEAAGGNIGQAADMLGMSRPTFWRKRKRFNL